MSSGSLPLATYHRAQSLGAGAYGSVVTVYDDDGNEFALKLFDDVDDEEECSSEEYDEETESEDEESEDYDDEEDDDDEEEDGEECDESTGNSTPLDLGALREISILRLLRHENSHPNVIAISDVKQAIDITEEEQEDVTMRFPGIAMPLFRHGRLTDAIASHLDKRNKVRLAYGILSAVAFLHVNGIIHRDIKSDNIMIEIDDEGQYHAILIDFSLAKIVEPTRMYSKTSPTEIMEDVFPITTSGIEGEDTHTSSVGTPTYRAPECVKEEPYGLPSDLYSVGVVLLELVRGSCIESFKDKGAFKIVTEALGQLPDQPFANLIRGLLESDPKKRLTAEEALGHPLFLKFGFNGLVFDKTFRVLNLKEALPLEVEDVKPDEKSLKKRLDLIQKICYDLDCKNPLVQHAAWAYATQLSQLDDCIYDIGESQGLVDCVVLASRFFEKELWDLDDIEGLDRGIFKQCPWSAHDYVDNEGTIWMLMDFCLYPRQLTK